MRKETKREKKDLRSRSRVEEKLGHSQFRLVYESANKWAIVATGGERLGYITDRKPYPIHLEEKKSSGFLDWFFGIE